MRILWMFLAATLAWSFVAAAAEPKGAAQAVQSGPGSIVVGTMSVPVVNMRRVRAYEYAVVGVRVSDAARYLKQVCEQRFDIADAFIMHMHGKPFTGGYETEGVRAQQELLAVARQVGGDFITAVDISWSKAPRPADPTVFGNAQSYVACKTN